MRFEEYKPLREALHNGAFTKQQLVELLSTVIERACRIQEQELAVAQHELCKAYEAYDAGIDEVDAREAQFAEPEPERIAP